MKQLAEILLRWQYREGGCGYRESGAPHICAPVTGERHVGKNIQMKKNHRSKMCSKPIHHCHMKLFLICQCISQAITGLVLMNTSLIDISKQFGKTF